MATGQEIDHGKIFDWGRTSADYAAYRDIYPEEFYKKILALGLCGPGKNILDIGTGTGVLPRNLYRYGGHFTGIDSSENQIEQAQLLSKNMQMDIGFQSVSAEKMEFLAESFDTVTACQCFAYFDHETLAPRVHKILKPGGRFAVLYMAWLPFEDTIAGKSEELILKYNPLWSGCKETRRAISIPPVYLNFFILEHQEVYDLHVPFTRESWRGRVKTCRGVGASLSEEEIRQFEAEHKKLLDKIAPAKFDVLHYAAVAVLKKK